jgi:hypothetical protein
VALSPKVVNPSFDVQDDMHAMFSRLWKRTRSVQRRLPGIVDMIKAGEVADNVTIA